MFSFFSRVALFYQTNPFSNQEGDSCINQLLDTSKTLA